MILKLEKDLMVLPSQCDDTACLSVNSIFGIFQDLASEHAPLMGMGAPDLAKDGLFWRTVKTKIRIVRRPEMLKPMHAESWPEEPGKIRCNRFYRLTDEHGLLAEGKTEWAIVHLQSGKLIPTAQAYNQTLRHMEETLLSEPFARVREDFSDAETLEHYRVRSTDIDLGQHMNNAAYPRVMLGALSTEALREKPICEMDVLFRSPSYEGEVLRLCRRETETGIELGLFHADGSPAALARILLSSC